MSTRIPFVAAVALLTLVQVSTSSHAQAPAAANLDLVDGLESYLQCKEACDNTDAVTRLSCAPQNLIDGDPADIAPAFVDAATSSAGAYILADTDSGAVVSQQLVAVDLLPNVPHTFSVFIQKNDSATAAVSIEVSGGEEVESIYINPVDGRPFISGELKTTVSSACASTVFGGPAGTTTPNDGEVCSVGDWWQLSFEYTPTGSTVEISLFPARGDLLTPILQMFMSFEDASSQGTAVIYAPEFIRGGIAPCSNLPDYDRNLDGLTDGIDHELALLELWDADQVCNAANGAIKHKSVCDLENCINAGGTPAACNDADGDGLLDSDEAIYGSNVNVAQQACTSGLSCDAGFNEECLWIREANSAMCVPRQCEDRCSAQSLIQNVDGDAVVVAAACSGECTAFHIETVASDNNELILKVVYDYSPSLPRVLDLYLTYDDRSLSLVNARPLDGLVSRAKDIQVRFPLPTSAGEGNLRLTVLGSSSSLPIKPGDLVELVFQRTSPLQSSSAVAFSADPMHRSYSMAPGPGEFRQRPQDNVDAEGQYLDDDSMWGPGVSIGAYDPDGDQLLLHYSFNNPRSPLDIARVRSPETLCGLIQSCAAETDEATAARWTSTYAALQRGYSQYSQQITGVVGSAAFFDGKTDHLELPLTFNDPVVRGNQSFSLSTWIYNEGGALATEPLHSRAQGRVLFAHVVPESERTQFALVAKDATSSTFNLQFVQGDLGIALSSPNQPIVYDIGELPSATWIHIGMALDAESQTVHFYVDGAPAPADSNGVVLNPFTFDSDVDSDAAPVCPRVQSASIDLHFQGRDIPGGKPPENLYVASAENNLYGVEQMAPTGLGSRSLVRSGESSAREPSYSPIADRLAYSSSDGTGNYEIWIANGDGSEPRKITSGFGDTARGIFARRPRWAPDGSAIVFESNTFSTSQNDNTWAHAYHLYYIPYDVMTGTVVVPFGAGTVTELNYGDLSRVRVSPSRLLISDHRLTTVSQHHYNAIWLRGKFSEAGVDYRGELMATVADDGWENRSVYRILIPAEVRDVVPSPYKAFAAGPPEPTLGSETVLYAGHYSAPTGEQPQRKLLLGREWVSYEVANDFVIADPTCPGNTCTILYQPSADSYAISCWDLDRDDSCSAAENRDGQCVGVECCTVADCYPVEVTNLYLRYDAGAGKPDRDVLYQIAHTDGAALLATDRKLVLKSGEIVSGPYVKVDVRGDSATQPLAPGDVLGTIEFDGPPAGLSLQTRNRHQQLYVKSDLLPDPIPAARNLLELPRTGTRGFDPVYGGHFTRASELTPGSTFDSTYMSLRRAADGTMQPVVIYARPNTPRWERRSEAEDEGLLIEGRRFNEITSSSDMTGVGWQMPTANAGSVAAADGTAADGSGNATTLLLGHMQSSPHATIRAGALSWFSRADSPVEAMFVQPSGDAVFPTTTWQRYGVDAPAGDLSFFQAPAVSQFQVWGFQIEPFATFASSYIPTLSEPATRSPDILTYDTVPPEIEGGRWVIDVWPEWSSAEATSHMTVLSVGGNAHQLQFKVVAQGVVTLAVVADGLRVETPLLTFDAHDKLTITVDAAEGTLDVKTPTGLVSAQGSGWVMPSKNLRLGGIFGNDLSWSVYARISAPRTDPSVTNNAPLHRAPLPLDVPQVQFEHVQEAVFSPDADELLISGVQGARPQLARAGLTLDFNQNTASLNGFKALAIQPMRTAGLDWSRGYRAYPCNWVGAVRNVTDDMFLGAFRGGMDEFKFYNYVRSPEAFVSEASRGQDWLSLAGEDGVPGSATEVCARDMDCPPFKLCESGVCKVAVCVPTDEYPCLRGRCGALPLPVSVGEAQVTHACTAECEVDAQCFTQECKNGPCRFCAQGTNSCIECRATTRDYGSFSVDVIEGCPDRNSFSCEAGSCETECYAFENGQSIYLCDPALEYCHQGRCAGLNWSWQDLAPATFSGLGEMSYQVEHLRQNIAISQQNVIQIEAFGVADYLHAPEILVEGKHDFLKLLDESALPDDGWFEIGRIKVYNKTLSDASSAPYSLTTMRPANHIRMRLVTSPYDNMSGGATGLRSKERDFCLKSDWAQRWAERKVGNVTDVAVIATAKVLACSNRPASSRAQIGYRVGIPERDARQDCLAKFQDDPSALAQCGNTDPTFQEYLYGGQQAVMIKDIQVNGQGALNPALMTSNKICSYAATPGRGDTDPLAVDGMSHHRTVFGGSDIERSNQSSDGNWNVGELEANAGPALTDFEAKSKGAYALLNCNYADANDPGKMAALVIEGLLDEVYYAHTVATGQPLAPVGSMSETANGCLVEVDARRSEPCYEMIGDDATMDVQALVLERGAQENSTLDYELRRSFGYGDAVRSTCGDGYVNERETCDPASEFPAYQCQCVSNDPCVTSVMRSGTSPAECNVVCDVEYIVAAIAGDGCCPPGAAGEGDSDCASPTVDVARLDWSSAQYGNASTSWRYLWDDRNGRMYGPYTLDEPARVSIDGVRYIQVEGEVGFFGTQALVDAPGWQFSSLETELPEDTIITFMVDEVSLVEDSPIGPPKFETEYEKALMLQIDSSAGVAAQTQGIVSTFFLAAPFVEGQSGERASASMFAKIRSPSRQLELEIRGATDESIGTLELTHEWQRVVAAPFFPAAFFSQRAIVFTLQGQPHGQTLAWDLQLETSPFPTSPYPNSVGDPVRRADLVDFSAETLPPFTRQGKWRLPFIPYFSSSELGSDTVALASFHDGAGNGLFWFLAYDSESGTGGMGVTDGRSLTTEVPLSLWAGNLSWERHDRLVWIVDNDAKIMTVENLSSGGSVSLDTSLLPPIRPDWGMSAGRAPSSVVSAFVPHIPYFGLIGEPARDCSVPGSCVDKCPTDSSKIRPGVCGCGVPDTDVNLDGFADCDPSIESICGNGAVESGEACDGDCPMQVAQCEDDDVCTSNELEGSANACDAVCVFEPVTRCEDDGCCAPGCNANNDVDCEAICNNGVVEPGEACDGDCPSACTSPDVCQTAELVGSAQACDAACIVTDITACAADGCCAPGCNALNDPDCAPVCGNGLIEAGEACDGDCPTVCDDNNICTTDTLTGLASACDAVCSHTAVPTCSDCGNAVVESGENCDDGGESAECDADCSAVECGDGMLNASAGEACDDGSQSSTCNADCSFAVCGDGELNTLAGEICDDGGESATCDTDCSVPQCGDGVINFAFGEQCDGLGDGVPVAELDPTLVTAGHTALCNADCSAPICGDGVVNGAAGEACDDGEETGTCDADCTQSACGDGYVNTLAGEACDGDGFGVGGETAVCNSDCQPAACGDGVVNAAAGESCDGVACPQVAADCDDGNACTDDVLLGNADACTAACVHTEIVDCVLPLPTDVFGTSLMSWHRADLGVELDSGTGGVLKWVDQGPRGNDLVNPVGQPDLVTTGGGLFNGQPYLEFKHDDRDVLSTPVADYAGLDDPQVYAVMRLTNTQLQDNTAGRYFLWNLTTMHATDWGDYSVHDMWLGTSTGLITRLWDNVSATNVGYTGEFGSEFGLHESWQLLASGHKPAADGGQGDIRLDDGTTSIESSSAFSPSFDHGAGQRGWFVLGASTVNGDWGPDNSSAADVVIAEVIVLGSRATPAQETELRGYLNQRYGAQW